MSFNPKVAIIILNWNGLRDTLACLSSVLSLDYPNYEVVVVDNGSTDHSSAQIPEHFPKITFIQNQTNLGFAEGNNVGIRYALTTDAAYILLLNNDTLVDPKLLSAFMATFANNPKAGILGAKIYLFDHLQTLDHIGGKWNPKTASFDLIGNRALDDGTKWHSPEEIDYVCGAALIASRAVFETIGLLEARFFLIWEESDFCFRAKHAGFATYTCPDAKIWHKVSASFVGKPHSTYFWWRNRLLWIERNCTPKDKLKIWLKIIGPEIIHMYKIQGLKSIQLALTRWINPKADLHQKQEKLRKNKAAIRGIHDYFRRKFGNGPSWLFEKNQK